MSILAWCGWILVWATVAMAAGIGVSCLAMWDCGVGERWLPNTRRAAFYIHVLWILSGPLRWPLEYGPAALLHGLVGLREEWRDQCSAWRLVQFRLDNWRQTREERALGDERRRLNRHPGMCSYADDPASAPPATAEATAPPPSNGS